MNPQQTLPLHLLAGFAFNESDVTTAASVKLHPAYWVELV